ncbi:MAG: TonB-dependent receptor [Bacteroidetes bacterium]|nr:TonB-dependent receptor [Bacteroidota bacterium]
MRLISIFYLFLFLGVIEAKAQSNIRDTTRVHTKYLSEITLVGRNTRADIHFLPEVLGTQINAGKKNSLIVMENVQGNIATNTMRQVMAKVPGIQIWENDPSGIQINIGARGLSPNRSWEFNTRQNGYDISSDPFGYPEAYYTPQLSSVQRIQVVRGAGSLQYGPQFGGLVNFILKDGSDMSKPFQFETEQTAGSFGMFNTYNAIGGNANKSHYYAFWDRRNGDGSRPNSRYGVNTGYGSFHYNISNRLKAGVEVTHFDYLSHQPGGLTDAQFKQNHLQSVRSRNWFQVKWDMLALNLDYTIHEKSRINLKVFGMKGERNSIGFMQAPFIQDSINATTLQYNPRRVDMDRYNNAGAEIRYVNEYKIGNIKNTLATGVRFFTGATERLQNGRGDTGSSFNLNTYAPYVNDLDFITRNTAVFAENIIHVGKKFILIPGIRYENIINTAAGILNTKPASKESRTRQFFLLGVGAEYHIGQTELYANYSKAYRPVLFSDLTALSAIDIDPNLKDASGYNLDLGWRGSVKNWLFFDVSGYLLQYNNRIGIIATNSTNSFRTNVGNSASKGIEMLIEFSPIKAFSKSNKYGNITLFTSMALMQTRYQDFIRVVKDGNQLIETSLRGNRVENAPDHIIRSGITYTNKKITATIQHNLVDKVFSEATNMVAPTSDGFNGQIPAYQVMDISATYKINANFFLRGGINNLLDEKYFTRRASGYPGPGLMTAEPRNFFLTLGAKF